MAFHANERMLAGPSGGAAVKRSVSLPEVRHDMARLGGHLHGHGALSADVVCTAAGARWIDVNPRLVEPGNALAAGVDLTGALLAPATGSSPVAVADGRAGVVTRQLPLCLLGAAQHRRTRRAVATAWWGATTGRGVDAGSTEELTPSRHDRRTRVAVGLAALAVLAAPPARRWFSSGAVSGYALSPAGWAQRCATPAGGASGPTAPERAPRRGAV